MRGEATAALFALLRTPKLLAASPAGVHVDSGDRWLNQLRGEGVGY